MASKKSITRTYLLSMALVTAVSTGVVGSMWVYQEYEHFKRDERVLREDYTEARKALIEKQVDNAVDDIEKMVALARNKMLANVKWNVSKIMALLLALWAGTCLMVRRTAGKTQAAFSAFSSFFQKASSDSAKVETRELGFAEFEDLAASANRMVSERRRAEAALRESEEKYRHLFESAADAMFVMKRETITDCNSAALELLGASKEQIVGKPFTDFSPEFQPDGTPSLDGGMEKIKAALSGETQQFEWTHVKPDGTSFLAEVRLTNANLLGENHTLAAVRDITKRKQDEENHQRLAKAVEQSAEIIILTDTEGAIEYVNPAFERVMGYSRSEVLGENSRIWKSGKHNSQFYKQLWDTIKRGDVWSGRFTNKRKDGTLFEEKATISPICNASGKITGYVAVKRDVTHEKELETRLRQAQKMEAIGTLAGGIAHDFNNILTAIIGFAELAVVDIPKNSPAVKCLGEVLKSGERATDLVRQILTFSRQTEQQRVPMHVHTIAKEALKLLRGSLPSHIEIKQSIHSDCDTVCADPTQIHQVIMNLCTNAYHAMRDGDDDGVLTVKVEQITVDSRTAARHPGLKPGPHVLLTVADTGHGMDEKTKQHLFDPYFTTKEKGEGAGLGLATVHGIVESHEGAITVESEPGRGATFQVYFPTCDREKMDTAEKETDIAPEKGDTHILFVDDEEPIVEAQSIALRRHGYKVTAFTSSREALQTFSRDPRRFDAVITDQTMPKMRGHELTGKILAIRPDIPVILCSGFSEMGGEREFAKLGVREFVKKPVNSRKLVEAIRRVLNGNPSCQAIGDKVS